MFPADIDSDKPISGAQTQTLRGRKHIYKNILVSDCGWEEYYIQVRVTRDVNIFLKQISDQKRNIGSVQE